MKCGACGTDNRDAAKFCKGCGGKLAQAWQRAQADRPGPAPVAGNEALQAPAIVLTGQPLRPEPMPKAPCESPAAAAAAAAAGGSARGKGIFAIVASSVVLAVAVTGLVWSQRGQPAATPDMAESQATAAPVAVSSAPLLPSPTTVATPVAAPVETPAPAVASDNRAASAPTPAARPARKRAVRKPEAPPVVEAAPPPPAPAPPAPVAPPAPQATCAGLNFIARSRCLAAECAKPGIGVHPQCEAVRRQQRIDEEKRNPSGG